MGAALLDTSRWWGWVLISVISAFAVWFLGRLAHWVYAKNIRDPFRDAIRDLLHPVHRDVQAVARRVEAVDDRVDRLATDLLEHMKEEGDALGKIEAVSKKVDDLFQLVDQILRIGKGRRSGW